MDLKNKIHRQEYLFNCINAQKLLPRILPNVAKQLEINREKKQNMQYFVEHKLLELWDMLDRYCPQSIIELGSGLSTMIFAEYQKKGNFCEIISIDENKDYQDSVRETLLKNDIEFRVYDKIVDNDAMTVRYDYDFKDVEADFVYVDGPANTIENHDYTCSDTFTILENADLDVDTFFVYDFRISTVKKVVENSDRLKFKFGHPISVSGRHHSVGMTV